jgi:hypothetical protein
MKTIECITLIYRSRKYLDFIVDQMRRYCTDFDDVTVRFRVVANNATPEVLEHLETNYPDILWSKYESDPNSHYLNRVYLGYNYGAMVADSDYVCFLNSDFGLSPDWLKNLYKHISPQSVVSSRLIETGRLAPGPNALVKNFGEHPDNYREEDFLKEAVEISEAGGLARGGLYMPLLIERNLFIKSGGYPPGNININGVGTGGKMYMEGDVWYIRSLLRNKYKITHYTSFDSIVYHFQEGEKSE